VARISQYPAQITFSCTQAMHDFIHAEADRRNVSQSEVCRDLLAVGIEEYGQVQGVLLAGY